jgi:LDH2 family malate/lactate/ureidoglycolate dehydrogenase
MATAYTHAFFAIDIAAFTPLQEFQERVDEFVTYVKEAPCAEGFNEINVPGERGWDEKNRRIQEGIPLDEVTLGQLRTMAADLGISFPSNES